MQNVIINTPNRIADNIENFRLDAIADEKNYTASRITLIHDDDKPILFYSHKLNRSYRDPNDGYGGKEIIKAFTPSNFKAVADIVLEKKYTDTILAHKEHIRDYSPLTDIHSQKMNLFMDEDTAVFLSDIGINVDGLGEDFQSMESVASTAHMEEVSRSASELKRELNELQIKHCEIKEAMSDEFVECINPDTLSDEEFADQLAMETVPDYLLQQYLSVTDEIRIIKSKLGQVNREVFNETKQIIKLPARLMDKRDELFTL